MIALLISSSGAGRSIAQEPRNWGWQNRQAEWLYEAGLLTELDLAQTVQLEGAGEIPQTVKVSLNWAYADIGQVLLGITVEGLAVDVDDFTAPYYAPDVQLRDSAGNRLLHSSGGMFERPTPGDAGDHDAILRSAVSFGFDQFVAADNPSGIAEDYLATVYGYDLPGTLEMVVEIGLVWMNATNSVYKEVVSEPVEFVLIVPLQPGTMLNPGLTETRQGINLTLESLRITPTQAKARICYDLPDNRDWQPEGTLMIGDVAGQIAGWGMTNLPTPEDVSRCFELRFDVLYSGKPVELTLTVERLHVSVPESREFWDEVRTNLLPLSIEIEVHPQPGVPYRLVSAPDDMNETEQWQTIQSVIDGLLPEVEGPWTFVVPLID